MFDIIVIIMIVLLVLFDVLIAIRMSKQGDTIDLSVFKCEGYKKKQDIDRKKIDKLELDIKSYQKESVDLSKIDEAYSQADSEEADNE